MNIKRAKEEIRDAVMAYLLKNEQGEYEIPVIRQRPILLIGPPGIGKTQIMEQIAQECGIGLVSYTITHHTRQSAIGLPYITRKMYQGKEYSVTNYTMSEIIGSVYDAIEETGISEGILFLDEINCVSETLAPAMLQFLQCKMFGNHTVPEGWIIVAAGNPPEYNRSVREFDVVTMDRVKKIEVEANFAVWKEYAYRQEIHPAVISYLTVRSGYFYQMETTVDGNYFATPRGWEDLSHLIQVYEKLGKTADKEVVQQYIQYPKIARDFANYLELYNKYQKEYQVEEILKGQISEKFLKKLMHAPFDERFSVVSMVIGGLNRRFSETYRKEAAVTVLYEQLRTVKQKLGKDHTCAEILQDVTEAAAKKYQEKKRAKVFHREEEQAYRFALERLESYRSLIESEQNDEAQFALIREKFAEENADYEALQESAAHSLECALDFMEVAFGTGQEMVMFITELNTGFYSTQFLQEYECSRYYTYNKSLLLEEQNQAILRRIDMLGQLK